jgi:glucosamine-6-phosphate deaminase
MKMELLKVKDYEKMSKTVAKMIYKEILTSSSLVLGLATGGTPIGMYQSLIQQIQDNGLLLDHVRTVNLDEYVGISNEHPQSYHTYMKEHLFQYLDIPLEHVHIPNGNAADLDLECERFDQLIEQLGGVDLQVLGIGENGHIGFNEPGTSFSEKTHIVELTSSTRKANARFFDTLAEVPTHAVTMGIASILASKKILLLASGENKARAIRDFLYGEIGEELPVSALKNHSNVVVIADEAALSLVEGSERKSFYG